MTLNQQQLEAINYCEGPLLIQAGAGVGKTRVLAQKIMLLLDQGVSPSSILSFSFTSKAAKELSDRLMLDSKEELWITTFHSFCLRLLIDYKQYLNFSYIKVISESKKTAFLEELYKRSKLSLFMISYEQAVLYISTFKNNLISQECANSSVKSDLERAIVDFYIEYEAFKLDNGYIDFDDMICQAVQLLESEPTILNKYHLRFDYVFVDEYQDTNYVQNKLFLLLAKEAKHQVVVGDFDQMIYAWRGANRECMAQFCSYFKSVKEIVLEQNYRNSFLILSIANQLIESTKNRKAKRLVAQTDKGAPVELIILDDDADEISFVVRKIKELRFKESLQLKDIAILVRTHQHGQKLKIKLTKHGLISNLNSKRYSQLSDVVFISNVISYHLVQSDLEALKGIVSFLESKKIDIESVDEINETLTPKTIAFLTSFATFLDTCSDDGIRFVDELIPFLMPYLSPGYSQYSEIFHSHFSLRPYSLTQLKAKLLLLLNDQVEDLDSIQLMTAHHSKGKEFTAVFVLGLEEGNFPYTFGTSVDLDEERRVLYVAMTRAKEFLYLGFVRHRYYFGTKANMLVSSFIMGLNSSLFNVYFSEKAFMLEDSYTKSLKNSFPHHKLMQEYKEMLNSDSIAFDIHEGDSVVHQTLGEAIVLKKEGTGLNEIVHLQFKEGVKQLNLQYAPLFPKKES